MTNIIFQWAVVGAGPAGIAAVGKLLDAKINPSNILWLDPHFKVGDLGRFWQNISSNTKVRLFTKFLEDSQSFLYNKSPIDFKLNQLPPDDTCGLHYMVEPLQWISTHLCATVNKENAIIKHLSLAENIWTLQSDTNSYQAKNVILATGAEPEILHYPEIKTLPFETAIDLNRLKETININKTYAVFGSSHSAIIILQNLVTLNVKKIINFYRTPCRYAIDLGESILFDNTGLKGNAAIWARQNIDGKLPHNLARIISNEANLAQFLPECDEAIYAVGFKRKQTLSINDFPESLYNPHLGIIAPGLFGFGIAYPEIKTDSYGCVESQVGMWKFMVYLNRVLPIWLKYHT